MTTNPCCGPAVPSDGLLLEVASAVGQGPNHLAAFDAALRATGCANYNLVRLSSVIPPGSRVARVDSASPTGRWGDVLYVVYGVQYATAHGEGAYAGIGWVQASDPGEGLFVEHEGVTRESVETAIAESLESMCVGRGLSLPVTGSCVAGVDDAGGVPTAALVIAVYGSAGWGRVDTKEVL